MEAPYDFANRVLLMKLHPIRKARPFTRKSVWRRLWEVDRVSKAMVFSIVALVALLIAAALSEHADRNHPCARYRTCMDWDSMNVGDVSVPICQRWKYGMQKTPQACNEWGERLNRDDFTE